MPLRPKKGRDRSCSLLRVKDTGRFSQHRCRSLDKLCPALDRLMRLFVNHVSFLPCRAEVGTMKGRARRSVRSPSQRETLSRAAATTHDLCMTDSAAQHTGSAQHAASGPPDGTHEEYWDGRYRESDRIWSGNPNTELLRETPDLEPGTALDLGC